MVHGVRYTGYGTWSTVNIQQSKVNSQQSMLNSQKSTVKSQKSKVNSQPRLLHLCDFDGTLTRGDSLLRFLWFSLPVSRLAWGSFVVLIKFLSLFFWGKWSNSTAKSALLSTFFKGKTMVELNALGAGFCSKIVPGLLRTDLLETLRLAAKNGDTVVIVSASLDLWLRPFCHLEGFDLLCTELEYLDGKYTGRFSTPNCNGQEKAVRILTAYDLQSFEKTIAYGNSEGDAAMFDLADEVFKF